MIILVAYATVEGHTAEIASRIGRQIEAAGHQVILADLAQPGFGLPARIDAAILCAPIHAGRYPQSMVRFVQDWKSELMNIPAALVTVSLAIASKNEEERNEATGYPERLRAETGYVPAIQHHAAGALKYVEYDFFKRWMLRRIAEKEGGPVDTWRDHELTDWAALEGFVRSFLAHAGREAVA
ncbi:MAG: protoporphyrinogen oxidase [Nitratireductor sp.]|jgi:menaquinone-dependent protoporphyrinogen oxidase|nr:protoporphyrinogen oxidase [Nitratireductor sp.]